MTIGAAALRPYRRGLWLFPTALVLFLTGLDKRSIRHPTVDSILCGFTAKAFLEYTFSKTLDQLDSHGRTQDGVDVLFNGLVKCHCPENYTGKHCERCHKTSTILIDGKSKISEIEADRIDIWRE